MNQICFFLSHIPNHCVQCSKTLYTKTEAFFQDARVQQAISISRIVIGALALAGAGTLTAYSLLGKNVVAGCAALGCIALGISVLPLHCTMRAVCHIALETGRFLVHMASDEYEFRERETLFLSRSAREVYDPSSRYESEERVAVGDHRSSFPSFGDGETRITVGRK